MQQHPHKAQHSRGTAAAQRATQYAFARRARRRTDPPHCGRRCSSTAPHSVREMQPPRNVHTSRRAWATQLQSQCLPSAHVQPASAARLQASVVRREWNTLRKALPAGIRVSVPVPARVAWTGLHCACLTGPRGTHAAAHRRMQACAFESRPDLMRCIVVGPADTPYAIHTLRRTARHAAHGSARTETCATVCMQRCVRARCVCA